MCTKPADATPRRRVAAKLHAGVRLPLSTLKESRATLARSMYLDPEVPLAPFSLPFRLLERRGTQRARWLALWRVAHNPPSVATAVFRRGCRGTGGGQSSHNRARRLWGDRRAPAAPRSQLPPRLRLRLQVHLETRVWPGAIQYTTDYPSETAI